MLRNDTYLGVLTFGRWSGALGHRAKRTSPETWVQTGALFQPLVDSGLFADAQRLMDRHKRLSDEEALERLARAASPNVRLTGDLIDANPGLPCAAVYRKRFGGLKRAYALIGYSRARKPGMGPGRWPRPSRPAGT